MAGAYLMSCKECLRRIESGDVCSKSYIDDLFFEGDVNFVEDFFNKSDAFIARAKGYVNVI